MSSSIKLLLVDNDVHLLDILEDLFKEHGYSTARSTSLAAAMQQLNHDAFHLVISHVLDIMPLTTLKMTQSLSRCAYPTPTGLLTGWNLPTTTPGLDSFAFVVKKPFEIISLLALVDETLALPLDRQAMHHVFLVQLFFVALEQQNWEAITDVCHPEMRFIVQPSGPFITGREAYITFAKNLFAHTYRGSHFTQKVCFPFPNGITVRFRAEMQQAQGLTEYDEGGTVFRFLGDRIVLIGVDRPRMR